MMEYKRIPRHIGIIPDGDMQKAAADRAHSQLQPADARRAQGRRDRQRQRRGGQCLQKAEADPAR